MTPDFEISLSVADSRLLWQMVNSPNLVIPISEAKSGAELFQQLKEAAIAHGHHTEPAIGPTG